MAPSIIAIDGPAASGKSTLGKMLAAKLNYLFFDTGVMYRAVTLAALQRGIEIQDRAGVSALAETAVIDIRPASIDDGRDNDILLDGQDITWGIREERVDANVSPVSTYPGVRAALTVQQRRIGERGRVVMVGRDIGTIVLPNADLKIYLDASAEERAHRRHDELVARGQKADYEAILDGVRSRDRIDSGREVAPLCAAEDARLLDSDELNIDQVLEVVLGWIETGE